MDRGIVAKWCHFCVVEDFWVIDFICLLISIKMNDFGA